MLFAYFLAISPRKCFKKILLTSGLVFFLSRSLCLRLWVDDVVCFVSFSSLFVQETKLRSNRTPHPPALAVVFLVFFPRRFVLLRLFWPCVLFVLVFLRGAILGPVRFLDSLGTPLRPFSWTLGGKGVCSFFGLLFFPFCGFTRF